MASDVGGDGKKMNSRGGEEEKVTASVKCEGVKRTGGAQDGLQALALQSGLLAMLFMG